MAFMMNSASDQPIPFRYWASRMTVESVRSELWESGTIRAAESLDEICADLGIAVLEMPSCEPPYIAYVAEWGTANNPSSIAANTREAAILKCAYLAALSGC